MSQAVSPKAQQSGPLGLVLTGGGARGAYQAGVVKGVVEIAAKRGLANPFRIITGASAGAVNCGFLAATAHDLPRAAKNLGDFWSRLSTNEIYRSDFVSLSRVGWKWISDVAFGGLKRRKGAHALLDTSPLRGLLQQLIPFENVATNIRSGVIDAFEVTATDYQTSESISFVMSNSDSSHWVRSRRRSMAANIGLDHVMASAAIPLLFPPVRIGERHYGDGCLRNPAPLSPAIRLGSRRLLVIGVRQQKDMSQMNVGLEVKPTIGRVLSVILNSVLMDSTEFDIERLARINEMVRAVPKDLHSELPLHAIDYLHLRPSVDLGAFASELFSRLPDLLRYLIGGLGNPTEASELISYLLFEKEYTGYLVDLGYGDAMREKDRIEHLIFD